MNTVLTQAPSKCLKGGGSETCPGREAQPWPKAAHSPGHPAGTAHGTLHVPAQAKRGGQREAEPGQQPAPARALHWDESRQGSGSRKRGCRVLEIPPATMGVCGSGVTSRWFWESWWGCRCFLGGSTWAPLPWRPGCIICFSAVSWDSKWQVLPNPKCSTNSRKSRAGGN